MPSLDQFGRDIDRYSLMAADGWLILRFAARHVNGPAVVARPHAAGSGQPRLAPRRVIIAVVAADTRGHAAAGGNRLDDQLARQAGQRARISFSAARTSSTLSGVALAPMRPIRHTVAA